MRLEKVSRMRIKTKERKHAKMMYHLRNTYLHLKIESAYFFLNLTLVIELESEKAFKTKLLARYYHTPVSTMTSTRSMDFAKASLRLT